MYRMPPMPPQPMMPPGNQNMNNMNSMNNMNQGGPGPSKPLFPAAAQVSMVQDYKQCHMFTGSCNNYGVGKSCIHLQHSDNFSKAQSCDTLAMANSSVYFAGGGSPRSGWGLAHGSRMWCPLPFRLAAAHQVRGDCKKNENDFLAVIP